MNQARIFDDNHIPTIVSADDVLNGKINKNNSFVDLEYEFKVTFVKASRGHGSPYFRIYMSREDYRKLSPEQKDKYEILCQMRHLKETKWHIGWKDAVGSFCEIEKTISNPETNEYKRADAYFKGTNTCIEFQHSFIALDFECRNAFYQKLGINIIWLYDLSKAVVKRGDDGECQILEDNARGFFKISENEENLSKWPVFFQAKDGLIYRVSHLGRKETESKLKSTIRIFYPKGIYTKEQFIDGIMTNDKTFLSVDTDRETAQTLSDIKGLWDNNFSFMIVQDMSKEHDNQYFMNRNKNGDIFRDYQWGTIVYKYVSSDGKTYELKSDREYNLSKSEEKERKWKLIFSSPVRK